MAEHYLYGTVPAPTNPIRVLLVKMLNAIGGGGSGGSSSTLGGLSQGVGAPVAAPSNTAVTNAYFDTQTGQTYWWNVTTQAWQ